MSEHDEFGSAAAEIARPRRRQNDEKRNWTRDSKVLCARVHGQKHAYRALVVNVSRSGVLFTIVDPEFTVMRGEADLGLLGLRITSHFGEVFPIEFLGTNTVADCELVRISEKGEDDDYVVLLGCRFVQTLSDEECERLDLISVIPPDPAPPRLAELDFDDPAPVAAGETAAAGGGGGAVGGEAGGAGGGGGGASVVGGGVVVVQGAKAARRMSDTVRARPVRISETGTTVTIQDLLKLSVEQHATDLHIKSGSPVRLRVDGALREVGNRRLPADEVAGLVRGLLNADQFDRFHETGDLDLAYTLEGMGRFRINVLQSQGDPGMAIRRIPERVPSMVSLGLSPVCLALAERPRGLVLVTGPTGSGKSTTLAAMIHHVNETRDCHIVTMEDPIEYIHPEIKAHVTQREIGRDTADFGSALKRAMRQDPDVILVGEMRDLETISLAVTAAETGHLVFATLHTTSAVLTVDRIVDVFPPQQQRQIRMQLADCLQAVISQILLPKRGGGLVVAQEILVANDGVRALIRDGKSPQIANMMQTGSKEGMQMLEDSLNELVADGKISYDVAVSKANAPSRIEDPHEELRRTLGSED